MSKVDALINAGKEEIKPQYDFDFITRSLGLIQIHIGEEGQYAINPNKIESIAACGDNCRIYLETGRDYTLDGTQMAVLEATIKRRASEAQALQKEAIKANILAQQEAVGEINRGIQGAMLVGGSGKRKL